MIPSFELHLHVYSPGTPNKGSFGTWSHIYSVHAICLIFQSTSFVKQIVVVITCSTQRMPKSYCTSIDIYFFSVKSQLLAAINKLGGKCLHKRTWESHSANCPSAWEVMVFMIHHLVYFKQVNVIEQLSLQLESQRPSDAHNGRIHHSNSKLLHAEQHNCTSNWQRTIH